MYTYLIYLYAIVQIQFKNVWYTVSRLAKPPVAKKTVKPKFTDMTKGAFKNGEVCICTGLASNDRVRVQEWLATFIRRHFRDSHL